MAGNNCCDRNTYNTVDSTECESGIDEYQTGVAQTDKVIY